MFPTPAPQSFWWKMGISTPEPSFPTITSTLHTYETKVSNSPLLHTEPDKPLLQTKTNHLVDTLTKFATKEYLQDPYSFKATRFQKMNDPSPLTFRTHPNTILPPTLNLTAQSPSTIPTPTPPLPHPVIINHDSKITPPKTTRPSRRYHQRRTNQIAKHFTPILSQEENRAHALLTSTTLNNSRIISDSYGFKVNYEISKYKNAQNILLSYSKLKYNNRIFTSTYHDLCPSHISDSSMALGPLLGLGLKFCVQPPRPSSSAIKHSMTKFKCDVRLKFTFAGEFKRTITVKKIYVKSDWKPNVGSKTLQKMINLFQDTLINKRKAICSHNSATNLTKAQENILNTLCNNKNIFILQCDKNLGPGVMEKSLYIKEILKQHLQDKVKTYRLLSNREELSRITAVRTRLVKIVKGKLSLKEEIDYFRLNLSSDKPIFSP